MENMQFPKYKTEMQNKANGVPTKKNPQAFSNKILL